MFKRINERTAESLREISFETNVLPHAEGSCLIKFGNTHVLCTATVDDKVPPFLKGKGQGWVTAEYSMLPRATEQRTPRDSTKGQVNGRAQEFQRLIGRALRAVVDFTVMGERQIIIDCDVVRADGGTRTASITGGFIALHMAFDKLLKEKKIVKNPISNFISAISVGIVKGNVLLDLDYIEDSQADTDANFIMTEDGKIIEIQAAAEKQPFSEQHFFNMLKLAKSGTSRLIELQKQALQK